MSIRKKLKRIRLCVTLVLLAIVLYVVGSILIPPLIGTEKDIKSTISLPEANAERICLVDDNGEALYWRLRLIESATEEIVLATFDFRDDNSGRNIMSALIGAAERGVQVKLLIDGFNGWLQLGNSDYFEALVAHKNVEAKLYNPIKATSLWNVNYRSHDKYLIVDRSVYLMGGRNTNDLFLGDYSDEQNIDRDVVVYDGTVDDASSVTYLCHYFDEIWSLDVCESLDFNAESNALVSAAQALTKHYQTVLNTYGAYLGEIDWENETIQADGVTLLVGEIDATDKAPLILNTLSELMQEAEASVIIQTPYLMCDDNMYSALSAVAESVDDMMIVTNAAEIGANPWGCADYMNEIDSILNTGASVCEWAGDRSLHTKTILIDDHISIIGSYNFDARSTYLDTEIMLVIDSAELNEELRGEIAEAQRQSVILYPDGSKRIGADYTETELSFGKQALYLVLKILIRPFRYLL